MNELDILYQHAVDEQATTLLKLSKSLIISFPDSGTFTTLIQSKEITGSWNRYRLSDDCHHIMFYLTRKAFFVAYKLYLSGVELQRDGTGKRMSDEEVAAYD